MLQADQECGLCQTLFHPHDQIGSACNNPRVVTMGSQKSQGFLKVRGFKIFKTWQSQRNNPPLR
jgi:hypothetical protein